MDDLNFAGPLMDEARTRIQHGARLPAQMLLTRALMALDETGGTADAQRAELAQLFMEIGEPERAVYALGAQPNVISPTLARHAVYEAAAAFRGGTPPVNASSSFMRRMLRLPAFSAGEIRRVHAEMGALLDPHAAIRGDRPPIITERVYTICMMPRSGSNFLVKCLTDTGVLGRPGEYLHRNEPTALPSIAARFATASLDDVMAEVMARTRSMNDVFGIKLHIGMLLPLLVEGTFMHTLAPGKFIYTTRDDLLMQAISFVRAQMTGVWISKNKADAEPRFDFQRIHATVAQLSDMMTQWETFFALHDIQPLRVSYEAINSDVDAVVAEIADFMQIKLPGPTRFRERRDTLQRDAMNDVWRERFLAQIAAPVA